MQFVLRRIVILVLLTFWGLLPGMAGAEELLNTWATPWGDLALGYLSQQTSSSWRVTM